MISVRLHDISCNVDKHVGRSSMASQDLTAYDNLLDKKLVCFYLLTCGCFNISPGFLSVLLSWFFTSLPIDGVGKTGVA